jgi:hypothetical protein
VPIGTPLAVRITSELRSDRTRPGSRFDASLDEALVFEGREIASAGAAVTGRVLGAGLSVESPRRPFLELTLNTIAIGSQPVPVRTGLYRLVAPASSPGGGPSVAAVVIGAVAGGLVGAAAGGRGGGLAGAGAGAAAGAALTGSTETTATEYRIGNRITFKLAEPLALAKESQGGMP